MTNIYEQHNTTFKGVSAYVVTDKSGNRIATVAFKRANSVTCFLHILGLQMVKARANGGGYDMCSAAFDSAMDKVNIPDETAPIDARDYTNIVIAFRKAGTIGNDGSEWNRALRDAGFNVLQAV